MKASNKNPTLPAESYEEFILFDGVRWVVLMQAHKF